MTMHELMTETGALSGLVLASGTAYIIYLTVKGSKR